MTAAAAHPLPTLRRHQREALEALQGAWARERRQAWVVLPPGAGKTLVGLESARRLVGDGTVGRAVVLGPNTAIQGQWAAQARGLGMQAGTDRGLQAELTCLTYQSLAVFDPEPPEDAEAPGIPPGTERPGSTPLLDRLHDNGRALVRALREAGPILLVLDECHHLLEVWGRLVAELLEELPQALVLGLTATPPEALTADQARLVDDLFGDVVYETSIPAVVREGDLAPFAELVWLTQPTPGEQDWLAEGALRFAELTAALMRPGFGSTGFLTWLDRRLVTRDGQDPGWPALVRAEPELTTAALRLHHAGLLALPPGARLGEQDRVEPTADDWMVLVDDWLRHGLAGSGDPGDPDDPDDPAAADDAAVLAAVRRALPSVGWVWTRHGVRRGRTPVDRVLARSESKTTATLEILDHEHRTLGEDLRMLVLCDHEQAGATLPVDLDGVISPQAGSARAVLAALLGSPAGADAVLVTGRTVAGAEDTLHRLLDHVRAGDPAVAERLRVVPDADGGPAAHLEGGWTSRAWVRHVTSFFETGGTRVLVGTRGLLGEGWDARRITGLVDLTAVTTTTAVVQTRGRALRTDPLRPDKVALNWSVICVAAEHPRGDNDWRRLVRKHAGFFGVDEDGDVVDGVAHIDPALSAYAPPPPEDFGDVNARMVLRAEDRAAVRERWAVGTAYDDRPVRTVRISPRPGTRLGSGVGLPVVVQRAAGVESRGPVVEVGGPAVPAVAGRVGAGLGVLGAVVTGSLVPLLVGLVLLVLGEAVRWRLRVAAQEARGRELLAALAEPPSVARIAAAVADGLLAADLVSRGADAVRVEVDRHGDYRCLLSGVGEAESVVFAEALDDAVSPLVAPRYLVPRWVALPVEGSAQEARRVGRGEPRAAAWAAWHAVPTLLGVNAGRARAYAEAWDRWVGGGAAVFTGSPEGAGVLAAQVGADPLDVSTVMRRQWT